MKRKAMLLIMVILIVLISGCSVFSTSNSTSRRALEKNLTLWDSFSMQGIVEINYKALSFRKNFTMRKDGNEFNFKVLNAGLMGLNPKPLVSISYADSLTIDASGFAGGEGFIPSNIEIGNLGHDLSLSKYLLPIADEIIMNRTINRMELDFNFNKKMQLVSVGKSDKDKVTFEYDLNNNPERIAIVVDGIEFLIINIDNYKKR